MKLSKLKLKNYRCFGSEEQVILIDQLTTFIGNNSTGKTAALSAINCMFSENSNDRILHRSDFHLPKNILPDEMEQQSLYKGLEYNAVYFIGLEDSAFWNFRNQPDEDRCTFFVALSRAKASVTFTFCKKRSGMKCPMQRHNAINEFFDLLQRPGIAEVKRFQNR